MGVNLIWSISLGILAVTAGLFIFTVLGGIQLTDTAIVVIGILQVLVLPIFVSTTIRKNLKPKPVKRHKRK